MDSNNITNSEKKRRSASMDANELAKKDLLVIGDIIRGKKNKR